VEPAAKADSPVLMSNIVQNLAAVAFHVLVGLACVVTGIIAKDLYQGYRDPGASAERMLRVSRIASVAVSTTSCHIPMLRSRMPGSS